MAALPYSTPRQCATWDNRIIQLWVGDAADLNVYAGADPTDRSGKEYLTAAAVRWSADAKPAGYRRAFANPSGWRPTATRIGTRSTPSSSRWPGCGRSPTGPPDMAVKHARRAFPAPGLLSRQAGTGYEGQRATPLPRGARRRLGGPERRRGRPEHTANALGRCCSNPPNTDYSLTLSKTCSVTLDSSRDCR